MRTRPLRELCGLTLLVLLLHLLAWRLAAGATLRPAAAAAGVRWLVLARTVVAQRPLPSISPVATDARGAPAARASPPTQANGLARAAAPAPPRARASPAGAGGAAPARARAAPAWPVYATRVPPSTRVHYRLVDGLAAARAGASAPPEAAEGDADLEWRHEAGAFTLRLATAPPGRPPREWLAAGGLDTAGVAPGHLVQRERGRDVRAIEFDRRTGRVRFSAAVPDKPFAAGAQDRWSWIAQLAAIAEAGSAGGRAVPPGTRWVLQVAGLRGGLDRWQFLVLADARAPPELADAGQDLPGPAGRAPGLLHVLREADRPYDLRIEAWLSPALHHLPAGLRMSTPPGPWSLSLWQRGDGQDERGAASGAPGPGS